MWLLYMIVLEQLSWNLHHYRYTGDFGSTEEQNNAHVLVVGGQWNDNKWHDVTLARSNGTHVTLKVDEQVGTHSSAMDFEQLNLDKSLFIGGISKSEVGTSYVIFTLSSCSIGESNDLDYPGKAKNIFHLSLLWKFFVW